MKRNEAVLNVGTGAHLGRRSKQESDATGADLAEQLLFLRLSIGVMDEGYFVFGNTAINELLFQVIIDRERAFKRKKLVGRDLVERLDSSFISVVRLFHQVAKASGFCCLRLLRR
ncbi:hypothetical protein D3C80_1355400 [compost metagenome]